MTSDLKPRDRCPKCSSKLITECEDPLEEYCIEPGCDYYRAETLGGGVFSQ